MQDVGGLFFRRKESYYDLFCEKIGKDLHMDIFCILMYIILVDKLRL